MVLFIPREIVLFMMRRDFFARQTILPRSRRTRLSQPHRAERSRNRYLGDSWTYGAGVPSDAAWPHVLSERLNRQVYNMGVPGTGPFQSREILYQALQLHPKVVIFGFYFGNDLVDDFLFAEKYNKLSEFLTPEVII
jgi:hypothetical protein